MRRSLAVLTGLSRQSIQTHSKPLSLHCSSASKRADTQNIDYSRCILVRAVGEDRATRRAIDEVQLSHGAKTRNSHGGWLNKSGGSLTGKSAGLLSRRQGSESPPPLQCHLEVGPLAALTCMAR